MNWKRLWQAWAVGSGVWMVAVAALAWPAIFPRQATTLYYSATDNSLSESSFDLPESEDFRNNNFVRMERPERGVNVVFATSADAGVMLPLSKDERVAAAEKCASESSEGKCQVTWLAVPVPLGELHSKPIFDEIFVRAEQIRKETRLSSAYLAAAIGLTLPAALGLLLRWFAKASKRDRRRRRLRRPAMAAPISRPEREPRDRP